MHRRDEAQLGYFAEAMREAMDKKGFDIRVTADKLGMSYEMTRKLVMSKAFPSTLLREKICKVLGMSPSEVEKKLVADRIRKKYGSIPQQIAGTSARVQRIERILPKLTEQQFRMLVTIGEGMVRSNQELTDSFYRDDSIQDARPDFNGITLDSSLSSLLPPTP